MYTHSVYIKVIAIKSYLKGKIRCTLGQHFAQKCVNIGEKNPCQNAKIVAGQFLKIDLIIRELRES